MWWSFSALSNKPVNSPQNLQTLQIKTHKRFKRTLTYYDIDNTMQIFREIPFFRPQKFYVFGSYFRMLAVILVSDFCKKTKQRTVSCIHQIKGLHKFRVQVNSWQNICSRVNCLFTNNQGKGRSVNKHITVPWAPSFVEEQHLRYIYSFGDTVLKLLFLGNSTSIVLLTNSTETHFLN